MSLLLDALKKAELAKQGGRPANAAPSALELAPSPLPSPLPLASAAEKPIITRENLPNITSQLEILSEDLPSSASSKASVETAAPRRSPSVAPMQTAPEPVFAAEPMQGQAAAKQLFEAKGLEDYNPRKPFYYTVGALGVFAIGTIVYFWWQLQPRYAVVTAAVANAPARPFTPLSPPPATPVAVDPLASLGPNPGPNSAQTGQRPTAAAPEIRAGGGQAAQTTPVATAGAAPSSLTQTPNAAATPITSANSPLVITRSTPAPSLGERAAAAPRSRPADAARAPAIISMAARTDQQLERAYDAYQKGDLATARQSYVESLKGDPVNRDALLGLAAIDARSGQFDSAEARYLKLLESDPRDAHALAGLIALRGQADPAQSESRLKSMIASQPEAGFLHFALGNQMAAQARWPEAQAAYFKALSNEPDNPDYAYNLAVSLDHIRQSKLALEYYQKALTLTLGSARPSTFERTRATTRIRELQQ